MKKKGRSSINNLDVGMGGLFLLLQGYTVGNVEGTLKAVG